MIYSKNDREEAGFIEPIFGSDMEKEGLQKYRLRQEPVAPEVAYRLVKDQLLDEGNARLNLATFCQTYMEPEAVILMSETLEKNIIDKSEYPRTSEIENRCINIIAGLWNAPTNEKFIGTSTIGSSEACMLAGMAMKYAWQDRVQGLGLDIHAQKPNLVISSGYQVCWEKFGAYWDIELRAVPMTKGNMRLDLDSVLDYVDEFTIGIVGILGITYTGTYDDIKTLNDLVGDYNKNTEYKIFIHVDAASGGFFAPFVDPDLEWDFRLSNVISINSSGHKYGLVFPGVGWILWRDERHIPKKLLFNVSYLGGEIPTMAINFSHSAVQIIGQYYNFVRYGYNGYKKIHERTREVALFLSEKIRETGYFEIINKGSDLPVICYGLKEGGFKWSLYDLSDRLLMKGWQVPTYPLPKNLHDQIIHRIVARGDLGMNMAQNFIQDLNQALHDLDKSHLLFHKKPSNKKYGFTH